MNLGTLCRAANISCPPDQADLTVGSVSVDSRCRAENSLFVCIRGLHHDSHRFIPEAVRNGARWVLVQEDCFSGPIPDVTVLRTSDTRRASANLYNAFYGFPAGRMRFIGVTGTNGKTTVTHLLRAILQTSLCRCGLIGTVGCESAGRHLENRMNDRLANMTTPDPPELYRMLSEMADDGVEYVLMEVTSHALALGKLEPIRFDAGIFTNLTPEHLDFHGTMDAYAEAKSGLFRRCALSVINVDSPYADRMISAAAGRVATCSAAGNRADYRATDVCRDGQNGVGYLLSSARSRLSIRCAIPGEFSVMNSMQAAVCAKELGFGNAAIRDALASIGGVRGRMERLKLGPDADFSVIIDYAHTPDALEKLLRTANDLRRPGERTVLVFGCGGDRDRSKRPLMGAVASRYADDVIVTSDNSRSEDPEEIIRQILTGIDPAKPVRVIPDRAEAIRTAVRTALPGDIILLAGKGHEEYEITKTGKRPFRERELVRDALAERSRPDRQT